MQCACLADPCRFWQDQLKRQGKTAMTSEQLQEFKQPTLDKYEAEGDQI